MAFLYSCATSKNTSYFQTITRDTTLPGPVNPNPEIKIKENDVLAITVSSLSPAEDAFFNSAATNSGSGMPPGYIVRLGGYITMHRLGEILVAGLSRKQLQDKLQKELLPYLKDPIVNVQFQNHKVTVFGEVNGAKIINMPEEQMSLIDVLVTSGDLKEGARSDKIMIIREEGNQKKVKHINLQDNSIFNSSWYYVQPNDMIYVSQDFEKKIKDEKRSNIQQSIGFVTAGITMIFLIVDRLTR